jgi:hypothetical protein
VRHILEISSTWEFKGNLDMKSIQEMCPDYQSKTTTDSPCKYRDKLPLSVGVMHHPIWKKENLWRTLLVKKMTEVIEKQDLNYSVSDNDMNFNKKMIIESVMCEWVNFMVIMGRPKKASDAVAAVIMEKYGFSKEFTAELKERLKEF